jgi:outer membrane protein OmpA-like peptidoglycan-associated protein
MKSIITVLPCTFGLLIAGCATAPPKELLDARADYQKAASGMAAQYAPAQLHTAQAQLADAENAFTNDPKAQKTRDLAYIADRKAQLAEVVGQQEMENKKKVAAEGDYMTTQGQQLNKTREQLAAESQMTASERAARMSAEGRAAQLQADKEAADAKNAELQAALAKLAAVKEEERGLVITLSGSVLFASDKAVLLPEAQTRLNQVATALLANKDRTMVVQGYTDSRGSDEHNMDLSRRRAEAVKNYLVGQGLPPEKLSSEGLGKDRPVADNTSAEGRANNRRVEIVVAPKKANE